jgi:uncharacterized damage-inducible protein DinB
MDLSEARMLLDYGEWARDRVLDAVAPLSRDEYLKDRSNSFPSLRDTLVHMYSAEWIWCSRWVGEAPTAMLDPTTFPELEDLRRAWAAHAPRLHGVLDRLGEDGVNREIEYRTTDGRAWRQRFTDTFRHLINHGTYHRGQVTTMLRQMGAAPPKSTDLITFHRERTAAGKGPE